jgi:hypothetical protein
MVIKTSKIMKMFHFIIILGLIWGVTACTGEAPEIQKNDSTPPSTVEATTFVSPISPISPIAVATPNLAPSPTPKVTVVVEINPVATLAGEITLNGKKLYYITTPIHDPLVLTGMAADDKFIWLVDNKANSFLALDPKTGETGTVLPFPPALGPDPNITGLTWDGENFWLTEVNSKTVYQYDPQFKEQLNKFTTTTHPGNIAWDGQSIWISSREKAEIQNWSINGQIVKSYPVPGAEITGLAWGANKLWYVDAIEKVIRRWDPNSSDTKIVITDALAPKSFGSLSWKENSLLLLDDMGGRLLVFDMDEFKFTK